MINFIKSFFGSGKVRVEFTDCATRERHVVRVPYVGAWDEQDCIDEVHRTLWLNYDIRATNIIVLGHISG
jgi:hypothetical protein